jgi:hypothetical protein
MVGAGICCRTVMDVVVLDTEHSQVFVNRVAVVAVNMVEMHSDVPSLANATDAGVPSQ